MHREPISSEWALSSLLSQPSGPEHEYSARVEIILYHTTKMAHRYKLTRRQYILTRSHCHLTIGVGPSHVSGSGTSRSTYKVHSAFTHFLFVFHIHPSLLDSKDCEHSILSVATHVFALEAAPSRSSTMIDHERFAPLKNLKDFLPTVTIFALASVVVDD